MAMGRMVRVVKASPRKAARPIRRRRYARRQSGKELKYFDTALSFTFDTTGEVPATGQLLTIAQGVDENQRVGRKCVIKSIQLRGSTVGVPAAAASFATTVYLYVVLDKQCNGAAAAVTDVFTSADLSKAFRVLDNQDRFVILKKLRMRHVSQAGVTTAYNVTNIPFDFYKKCNIPIEYDNSVTTGAIGSIRSNNIFLIAGADSQSDDLVTLGGNCRVRFSDN